MIVYITVHDNNVLLWYILCSLGTLIKGIYELSCHNNAIHLHIFYIIICKEYDVYPHQEWSILNKVYMVQFELYPVTEVYTCFDSYHWFYTFV